MFKWCLCKINDELFSVSPETVNTFLKMKYSGGFKGWASLDLERQKCKDCYKCVRLCEVKAIRIRMNTTFVASRVCGMRSVSGGLSTECDYIYQGYSVDQVHGEEPGEDRCIFGFQRTWGIWRCRSEQMAAALHQLGFLYVHETARSCRICCAGIHGV